MKHEAYFYGKRTKAADKIVEISAFYGMINMDYSREVFVLSDYVTILGARGSMAASGSKYSEYGGATSSYLVSLGGGTVILDGGTGLLNLPKAALKLPSLDILLSHSHADHLMGLGVLAYAGNLSIYLKTRGGLSPEEQVKRFYSPPLWPVAPRAEYRELEESFTLGGIAIETAEGVHPGGVSLIKLSGGGKTVVYASDTILSCGSSFADFAADCDLLLCDGQYCASEWATHSTWGHSTWETAAEAALAAGAKKLRIIHHSPTRTDSELDAFAAELRRSGYDWDFAREGEEVAL